jgi:hypothetical protein
MGMGKRTPSGASRGIEEEGGRGRMAGEFEREDRQGFEGKALRLKLFEFFATFALKA